MKSQEPLALVPEKIQHSIYKNTTTSYGLTLVVGRPFPPEVGVQVERIQRHLDALAPGQCTWYSLGQLHTTLVAPLRGRYRDYPPLRREELPADIEGFIHDLDAFFAQLEPFTLEFAGPQIAEDGTITIAEHSLVYQLSSQLRQHPELDRPKHDRGLHIAIGFLHNSQPFASDRERELFLQGFHSLRSCHTGRIPVQRVRLIHYANRTLKRIIGQVSFTLGESSLLTTERLLQDLGISVA
jgi:hypothetical protein